MLRNRLLFYYWYVLMCFKIHLTELVIQVAEPGARFLVQILVCHLVMCDLGLVT